MTRRELTKRLQRLSEEAERNGMMGEAALLLWVAEMVRLRKAREMAEALVKGRGRVLPQDRLSPSSN